MGSSDPGTESLLGPKVRPWVGLGLVVLGIQCWLTLGQGEYGLRMQRWLLFAAMGLSIVPPFNRWFMGWLDRCRSPSISARRGIAVATALLAAFYFPITAYHQNRDFQPIWQDSQSYAIQVQMMSRGLLWMHPHPLADFFDTFQMLVTPVYASMYFPGASLFYLPSVWLGIPYWVISTMLAGACVGLIYWIVSDLIDGVAGLLAALMLVSLEQFRQVSIMLLGHPAIILLGLLMIALWLAWRAKPSWRLAAAIGVASGWAAITRPLDALIIAIPIGIDILLRLRTEHPRAWLRNIAPLIAAAIPFLTLQIIFNLGVTGSLARTPFDLHADLYYPGTSIGFHEFDPTLRPASAAPQKQKFHDDWTIPAIQRHQSGKVLSNWLNEDLNHTLAFTLPHVWLVILLPAAILGLACARRRLILLIIPLWIGLYSFYTFFLPHYALLIAPAIILLALIGAQQLQHFWPSARNAVGTFITLSIVILSLTHTFELNRMVRDQKMDASELRIVQAKLDSSEVRRPAVVLFRFAPNSPPAIEPVYNTDVPWPDDAPIIRAHDRGDRNIEIFSYYSAIQPERTFYRYDRQDGSLTYLGVARELGRAN